MFSSIIVAPAVDYSSLEDVLVVLTPPQIGDAMSAAETSGASGNTNPATRNGEPGT